MDNFHFNDLTRGIATVTTDLPKYPARSKPGSLMTSTRQRLWDVLDWLDLQYAAGNWWKCGLNGLAWLLVLLLSACTYHPTSQETQNVNEMTTQMRTWGLGRFLVDLPGQWGYVEGHPITLYYGLGKDFEDIEVTIIEQGMTPAAFEAALAARSARIKAITNDETKGSMLLLTKKLDQNAVLMRYFEGTTLDNYHTHEINLLVGGVYVLLRADSYEGVIDPVEARLKKLASQISYVSDPARAGAGFILGPILIGGDHDHERATINFYDPRRLDMSFEVEISAITPDSDEHLFDRNEHFLPMFDGVSTLRKGKREIGGMQAEEQLLRVDRRESGESMRGILFAAETYRDKPALSRPTLSLGLEAMGGQYLKSEEEQAKTKRMVGYWSLPDFARDYDESTGEAPPPPIKPSLTEYEAQAVWNAILNSIRLRPDAVSPPVGQDKK